MKCLPTNTLLTYLAVSLFKLAPFSLHLPPSLSLTTTVMEDNRGKKKLPGPKFCINDHVDILVEILKRLDGDTLAVAACVCQLWHSITRHDSLWENLCFRHVPSPPPSGIKPVVLALGGYKRLYMLCLRPVLNRLSRFGLRDRVDHVQLTLSLFCVDCYERLGGGGGKLGESSASSSSSSLMFLCGPVNV